MKMDLLENKGNIRLVNIKAKPSPSYDVYIGRGNKWLGLEESKWHNPFPLKREGDRLEILNRHKQYMYTRPDLVKALPELKSKTLACYCVPRHCHGHNLIDMYNEFVGDDGAVDMEKFYARRLEVLGF